MKTSGQVAFIERRRAGVLFPAPEFVLLCKTNGASFRFENGQVEQWNPLKQLGLGAAAAGA